MSKQKKILKYHLELLNNLQVIEKLAILPTVSNHMKLHIIWNSWKNGWLVCIRKNLEFFQLFSLKKTKGLFLAKSDDLLVVEQPWCRPRKSGSVRPSILPTVRSVFQIFFIRNSHWKVHKKVETFASYKRQKSWRQMSK